MFNPELRELYSDNVIVELEKLAEDFEAKGIECWVYGLTDMYGIKAPKYYIMTMMILVRGNVFLKCNKDTKKSYHLKRMKISADCTHLGTEVTG